MRWEVFVLTPRQSEAVTQRHGRAGNEKDPRPFWGAGLWRLLDLERRGLGGFAAAEEVEGEEGGGSGGEGDGGWFGDGAERVHGEDDDGAVPSGAFVAGD